MSKEAIEKLRIKLADDRAKTFRSRLNDLFNDMMDLRAADDFILAAQGQ
jgi:hypothetical protein